MRKKKGEYQRWRELDVVVRRRCSTTVNKHCTEGPTNIKIGEKRRETKNIGKCTLPDAPEGL